MLINACQELNSDAACVEFRSIERATAGKPMSNDSLPRIECRYQYICNLLSFIFLITAPRFSRFDWLEIIDKNRAHFNVARDSKEIKSRKYVYTKAIF